MMPSTLIIRALYTPLATMLCLPKTTTMHTTTSHTNPLSLLWKTYTALPLANKTPTTGKMRSTRTRSCNKIPHTVPIPIRCLRLCLKRRWKWK